MAGRVIEEGNATFEIAVVATGRARTPVTVYRAGERASPVLLVEVNLANERARVDLLAKLPDEWRAAAEPMLVRLAVGVQEEQLRTAPEKGAEGDPFPVIEPWPDPIRGSAILDALVGLLADYVVLPEHSPPAVALWIAHTYLADVSHYTPYLHVQSPVRECGKTTLLEVLEHTAYRAQLTGGISAAALYRRIDRLGPTMLLDEMDTRLRADGGENLRNILNTGFQRSGRFSICVGDDHVDQDFSTFCPKVLAGIGRMWDTVTSRSIPIRLVRASKTELVGIRKIRGDRFAEVCRPFKRQLVRFANDVREALRDADPSVPDALGARQSDVWRPLLAIADAAGGDWPARARACAVALHGIPEDEGDYALLLLEDIRALFDAAQTGHLTSESIVEALAKREDRPWPEYHKDKPISKRQVATLLRRFDVRPKNVRYGPGAGDVAKGYEYADLLPVFMRYFQNRSATETPVKTPENSDKNNDVAVVADESGGVGPSVEPDIGEAWEPQMIRHPDGGSEFTPETLVVLRAQRDARMARLAALKGNAA